MLVFTKWRTIFIEKRIKYNLHHKPTERRNRTTIFLTITLNLLWLCFKRKLFDLPQYFNNYISHVRILNTLFKGYNNSISLCHFLQIIWIYSTSTTSPQQCLLQLHYMHLEVLGFSFVIVEKGLQWKHHGLVKT